MDNSQQVFLVPPVPTLHHQPQKCTTQMVQQRQLHHLQPQCKICGTTHKLLRCAKCKTIYYCSTDHQHLDWPTHKQECRQMAKKKQISHRLTQLTNGCGAININCPSNCNSSCSSSSASMDHHQQQQQQQQQQQPLQTCNNYNIDSTLIMDSHEKEILNSKAESNRSNFDTNSTTTDQMHITAQNDTLDLFDMIESSQEFMENAYYYQTTQLQEEPESKLLQHSNATSSTYEDALTRQQSPLQDDNDLVLIGQGMQTSSVENSSSQPQQQQHFLQQQQQQQHDYVPHQQQVHQCPIPQLSNHLINQHEKSSSYQIGTPVFDESIFENANEQRYEELCRNIINDMNQYGLSVVDDFLGRDNGLQILNEVHRMYSAGVFKDGQLVNNMKSEQDLRTIRGDKITWVKGVEPNCSNVGYLINQIDAVICRANSMLNNGKLGNYVIKERTKAMVACYPGSGSHYVMHVDNPNKDGRVITAIYYLNLNWDSRDSGGVLRIFPEQTKSVADIEPKFDRLIFFWSDKRNPHEVQPAHRTRYAITVWYFDANEREQALNRCKKTQNANETKNGSKSLNRITNPLTNSNIVDNTTATTTDLLTSSNSSSSSSASSLSSIPPTSEAASLNDNNSEATTTNLIQTTTNASRPIQVVRPNIYK